MIGEVLIGGLIFALQGKRPHVERGWLKQCREKEDWTVLPRNSVSTRDCGFNPMKHEVTCNGS